VTLYTVAAPYGIALATLAIPEDKVIAVVINPQKIALFIKFIFSIFNQIIYYSMYSDL
jgi:hypothetical protein